MAFMKRSGEVFHDDGGRAHLARVGKQRLRDYPMPAADVPLIPILRDWL